MLEYGDNVLAAELVRSLIESTCVYTMSNMYNKTNKKAYIKAMLSCYYLCSQEASGSDLSKMIRDLTKLKKGNFIVRFEILSNSKGSYLYGVDQCLDIVKSIHNRFCTGYISSEYTFIRNYLRR